MLVDQRMSHKVISVPPEMPVPEALAVLKKNHIRRAPVMKDGKMLGIISESDLLNASPSPVSTLSVWEMNFLMSKVPVKQVMTKKVITVEIGTPIEEAARIMVEAKIGGMPVTRDGKVIGMITETDLFKVFMELMGAREKGVRVSVLAEDKPGQIAKVSRLISDAGGNFLGFGSFAGPDPSLTIITFKVTGVKKEDIKKILGKDVKRVLDIR
ncbi:MAG: CBS and ACT domain-containing protein [Chloroflexi bacterium]|nr:CBS and ACT domain-containing protein [Chloroflexota bacterium]